MGKITMPDTVQIEQFLAIALTRRSSRKDAYACMKGKELWGIEGAIGAASRVFNMGSRTGDLSASETFVQGAGKAPSHWLLDQSLFKTLSKSVEKELLRPLPQADLPLNISLTGSARDK
jgi:hypothetical protein